MMSHDTEEVETSSPEWGDTEQADRQDNWSSLNESMFASKRSMGEAQTGGTASPSG